MIRGRTVDNCVIHRRSGCSVVGTEVVENAVPESGRVWDCIRMKLHKRGCRLIAPGNEFALDELVPITFAGQVYFIRSRRAAHCFTAERTAVEYVLRAGKGYALASSKPGACGMAHAREIAIREFIARAGNRNGLGKRGGIVSVEKLDVTENTPVAGNRHALGFVRTRARDHAATLADAGDITRQADQVRV